MKRLDILSLLLLVISCSKEPVATPEQPGTGNTGNLTGLLQKVEVISSATNEVYLQYLYEYNDSGKPSSITTSSSFPRNGVMVTTVATTRFVRDPQGRITAILYSPDSILTKSQMTYEGSSHILKYVNLYKKVAGVEVVIDSMLFEYDSQNLLQRTTQYNLQANGMFKITGYQDYTWDARGNLLTKQTYNDYDGNGTIDKSLKYTWEYDDNINPRYFNEPAIFYWSNLWPTGGSISNIKRQINDYPPNGAPDDELRYVLIYNAARKPLTEMPFPTTNSTSTTRYTYHP